MNATSPPASFLHPSSWHSVAYCVWQHDLHLETNKLSSWHQQPFKACRTISDLAVSLAHSALLTAHSFGSRPKIWEPYFLLPMLSRCSVISFVPTSCRFKMPRWLINLAYPKSLPSGKNVQSSDLAIRETPCQYQMAPQICADVE